jgi:phosphate transport system ATP-binding protein
LSAASPESPANPIKLELSSLSVSYGDVLALRGVSLAFAANKVHALIGPAGGGKTTLLRSINGLATEVDGAKIEGQIRLDGVDVRTLDESALRRRVALVFATPQPLPRSIYENLVFGPRLLGKKGRDELDKIARESLRAAELYAEVKDRLHSSALALSGGQQQRLCIARALALSPEVVMLDEPCSGLDPISTQRIEATLRELKSRYTFVLVTNNIKQAERVGDEVAFFLMGELVEHGPTARLYTAPRDKRTADYLSGRFG